MGAIYGRELRSAQVMGLPTIIPASALAAADSTTKAAGPTPADLDSIFSSPTPAMAKNYINQAIAKVKRTKQEYEYRALAFAEQEKLMRRHDIEMQKKFTLSFACLIFFFIGAPLGAIIKKGGLGTPLVISVLLFIVYYIIDNTGYKMARDGKIAVWEGIWLSSAVLLPLGVFFTYKAVGDSAVFNVDAYRNFFRRLAGLEDRRNLSLKEVHMDDVDPAEALRRLEAFAALTDNALGRLAACPRLLRPLRAGAASAPLRAPLNELVDYLSNTDDRRVISLLNEYPFAPRARRLNAIAVTTQALIRIYSEYNSKSPAL